MTTLVNGLIGAKEGVLVTIKDMTRLVNVIVMPRWCSGGYKRHYTHKLNVLSLTQVFGVVIPNRCCNGNRH